MEKNQVSIYLLCFVCSVFFYNKLFILVLCCYLMQVKCFQYWPCGQAAGHSNMLEFEDFKVYYLKEVGNEYFTIRTLELENFVVCMPLKLN